MAADVTFRRAVVDESGAIADMWLRSRAASVPAIPQPVHTDDDVRRYFAEVLVPTRETWVAEAAAGEIVGVLVLHDTSVDQLYIDPAWTGRGIGSRFVQIAKERRPEGLDLWAFQANVGALRFYGRHGFVEVDRTDGDNEEGAPDVRYSWRAVPPATS
ncbi:MAG: N-acetyltransferase family protein [Acidimicrobiales bacterium]